MQSSLSNLHVDKEFLFHLFDNVYDGVKIVDREGKFVFINRSAEKNMNIQREEWIGKKAVELLPHSIILKALETGIPQINKHSFVVNKNFIVHAAPLMVKGELIGAISTHKDGNEIDMLKKTFDQHTLNSYIQFLENELHLSKIAPFKADGFVVSKNSILVHELSKMKKMAPTDIPVLIRGESGVGKELVARNIHDLSNRIGKPYITINCAAIPENLLESELFGYESGAFTGARKNGKKGKFELANGGTIFLDEIGDLNYHLQAKLLRVLQQQELTRVGGEETISLDVRIIAATNQDLESMIQQNQFREDLYYRINGITFNIPPLRERKADIETLILYFLNELSSKYNKKLGISKEAHDVLVNHPLPGNVRELKNILEHGFVLAEAGNIEVNDLPKHILEQLNSKVSLPDSQPMAGHPLANSLFKSMDLNENIKKLEIALFIEALKKANHNKTKAIKILGISRQFFYDRLKKYGPEINQYLNRKY